MQLAVSWSVIVSSSTTIVEVQAWAHGFAEDAIRPTAAAQRSGSTPAARRVEVGVRGRAADACQFPPSSEAAARNVGVDASDRRRRAVVGLHRRLLLLQRHQHVHRRSGGMRHRRSTRRWLAPLCTDGPHTAAFACTEPGGGSDVRASAPEARRVDGGFVLSGQKIFITNAGLAHSLLIVADATDGDQRWA